MITDCHIHSFAKTEAPQTGAYVPPARDIHDYMDEAAPLGGAEGSRFGVDLCLAEGGQERQPQACKGRTRAGGGHPGTEAYGGTTRRVVCVSSPRAAWGQSALL